MLSQNSRLIQFDEAYGRLMEYSIRCNILPPVLRLKRTTIGKDE